MNSGTDDYLKGLLESIRSVNPGRWKVVVVDEHSQKLLGATLKQYDVLAENVTSMLYWVQLPIPLV
jgi:syntaxin-binding protein 1